MKNGFVQLPLDEYNSMRDEIEVLQDALDQSVPKIDYDLLTGILSNLVNVRDYYGNDEPMLEIDTRQLKPWVEEALSASAFGDRFQFRELSDYNCKATHTGCFEPIDEDDQA